MQVARQQVHGAAKPMMATCTSTSTAAALPPSSSDLAASTQSLPVSGPSLVPAPSTGASVARMAANAASEALCKVVVQGALSQVFQSTLTASSLVKCLPGRTAFMTMLAASMTMQETGQLQALAPSAANMGPEMGRFDWSRLAMFGILQVRLVCMYVCVCMSAHMCQ